jgi:hypothetical protein
MTSLSREYIISFFPILYIQYNDKNNNSIELDPYTTIMRSRNDLINENNQLKHDIDNKKIMMTNK